MKERNDILFFKGFRDVQIGKEHSFEAPWIMMIGRYFVLNIHLPMAIPHGVQSASGRNSGAKKLCSLITLGNTNHTIKRILFPCIILFASKVEVEARAIIAKTTSKKFGSFKSNFFLTFVFGNMVTGDTIIFSWSSQNTIFLDVINVKKALRLGTIGVQPFRLTLLCGATPTQVAPRH